MIRSKLQVYWTRYWMRYAGLSNLGRFATRLATWFAPPYYERRYLARLNSKGYFSPTAVIYHNNLSTGPNVFIDDHVVIFQDENGGSVHLDRGVHLYRGTLIQNGENGSLTIGTHTHIQPYCQLSAYKGDINIGSRVQIAPRCSFYPYDHSFEPGELIAKQPLKTKGGITIADDAWLGVGVIVLDGVRIGKGAVIGAGSVVTKDIPDGAIAVGVPARVVKMRSELDSERTPNH